ncbi:hypothetical protein [Achromobacter sp. UMC46]|uniref:hypothetical protein n=1 Tax=Achromobacter sp. UMC46 TaxID=1862319 RepID=UPI001C80FB10|nr:hypothetical protein [Achromobacter sp. UMC46]
MEKIRLDHFPAVPLAGAPTPIQKMDRLAAARPNHLQGVQRYVKPAIRVDGSHRGERYGVPTPGMFGAVTAGGTVRRSAAGPGV